MLKQTYCTKCKKNVELNNVRYIRLANSRLAIEGYCNTCSSKLLKTKVMPKSGKKKKKLTIIRKKEIGEKFRLGLANFKLG
jgi:NAD-dependent SIR2 family protein deacetylase